jgi:hypothetical protein
MYCKNVELLGPHQRIRDEHLGETSSSGRPVPLIDVLHRACLLWNQGDRPGLADFLACSGCARGESLWTVAQALSGILHEGEREADAAGGCWEARSGWCRRYGRRGCYSDGGVF